MKTFIYIHVCCINNWKDVFRKLMTKIRDSGLYDKVDEIRCNVLTSDANKDELDDVFKDSKITFKTSSDIKAFEVPTINWLYEDSKTDDFKVLYLHTKGIRHYNRPCEINVTDWVDYLVYFNIEQYSVCLEKLDEYDTVGVNLQSENVTHYSGNFWWSKSEYIRKLDKCKYESYTDPEFWLTREKKGKYCCLWQSGINHYEERYPLEIYMNKMSC